jgi:hypothetical protein
MIISKSDQNNEKLSLFNDFERLIQLAKTDSFSEAVSDEFVEQFSNFDCTWNLDTLFAIYWNRFEKNQFKVVISDNNSFLPRESDEFDCISWIPIYSSTTKKLFARKTFQKLISISHLSLFFNNAFMENKKLELSQFFKKVILQNLLKEQKMIFEAQQTDDFEYFIQKSCRKRISYPIDLYSKLVRYEHYWYNFKLFDIGKRTSSRSITSTSSDYQYLARKIFNKDGLRFPFDFFKKELIELSIDFLNNENLTGEQRSLLIDFFKNSLNSEDVLKNNMVDNFSALEKSLDEFISKLDSNLFGVGIDYKEDRLDPFVLIGKQFSTEEETKKANEILKNKIFNYLKGKQNCPAPYYYKVNELLYNEFKKNNYLVESFYNGVDLFKEVYLNKNPVVYSPLDSDFHFPYYDFQYKNYSDIENDINNYDIKTTKKIQESIKTLLESPFISFSKEISEHLHFVLSMPTID